MNTVQYQYSSDFVPQMTVPLLPSPSGPGPASGGYASAAPALQATASDLAMAWVPGMRTGALPAPYIGPGATARVAAKSAGFFNTAQGFFLEKGFGQRFFVPFRTS